MDVPLLERNIVPYKHCPCRAYSFRVVFHQGGDEPGVFDRLSIPIFLGIRIAILSEPASPSLKAKECYRVFQNGCILLLHKRLKFPNAELCLEVEN